MTPGDLLDCLDSEIDLARSVFARGRESLLSPVPSCPGWTLGDLVWHLSLAHHFWGEIVGEQRSTWEGFDEPARPADGELVAYFSAAADRLREVLRAADPDAACWTWSSDHTMRFIIRRIMHETAIHRWDAESALGDPSPIAPEFAADGIDEFLTFFAGNRKEGAAAAGGSVHIHCGDTAGEWTLRDGELRREHLKGDCALRGNAAGLLLVLWRRAPLSTVDVVGDSAVAERFVAGAALS
jgi:uncharacterized protein (TIGR03083 family)